MTEATQTAAELPIVADTTAATAAASDATPTMNVTLGSPLAPSAAASRAPSCLSLLGPLPVVDSAAALTQLASQMHVLTTPLPTMHAQVCMSTLEESVHAQLLRMDELSSELESLKRASVQANSQILPLIAQKQAAIAPLLQQVAAFDKYARELERHVAYVESRVDQVDAGCRRTAAAESDYAREREAASRTGVAADLLQAEKAVNKLWTSLKSLGSKPAVSSAATPSATSSSGTAVSLTVAPDASTVWTPFEPTTDFGDYFTVTAQTTSAASSEDTE